MEENPKTLQDLKSKVHRSLFWDVNNSGFNIHFQFNSQTKSTEQLSETQDSYKGHHYYPVQKVCHDLQNWQF